MKRIARGIYRDAYRFEVRATVNGITRSKSFPLTESPKVMKAWRERERVALRHAHPTACKHTLRADVERYLERPTVKTELSHPRLAQRLRWWVQRLGDKRRSQITPQLVAECLQSLTAAGMSPQTVIHYRQALANVYVALDGPAAYCPTKAVPRPKVGKRQVKTLSVPDVQRILAAIHEQDSPNAARIMVMASTGLPPSSIGRLTLEDIDLVNGTVRVPPRQKGDGVDGRVLPLTTAGISAFKHFVTVGAVGPFNRDMMGRMFLRAAAQCGFTITDRKKGITGGVSVYWLRHAFLTNLLIACRDLEAVSQMAMHSSLQTTRHYTRAAVSTALANAVARMDENLAEESSRPAQNAVPLVH